MEAAEASLESVSAATEETSVKKKKKKVVKKKKKKEAEKEIPKPELSSYLKNFVSHRTQQCKTYLNNIYFRSKKKERALK